MISTGERSTTSTRQPISAGWGRGYTSGWEADIYAKTREVLDGIENDLWEKYGLEGSYRFKWLSIDVSKTGWKITKEGAKVLYETPLKDQGVQFTEKGGFEPPVFTWVFEYDPNIPGAKPESGRTHETADSLREVRGSEDGQEG